MCISNILFSYALWGLSWGERGKISRAFIESHPTEAVYALTQVVVLLASL